MKPGDLIRLNLPHAPFFRVHLKDGDTWDPIRGTTVSRDDLLLVLESRHVAYPSCEPYYELKVMCGEKVGWVTDENMKLVDLHPVL